MLKKAVIVAGGFGTRISSAYPDTPKALISILGKPILQRQIEILKENGIEEIFITLGYKGKMVEQFICEEVMDEIDIKCIFEQEPLGTAGALYFIRNSIREDFLLCMGDILFDIDIQRLGKFHHNKNALATLVVHPNSHPYDSDIVVMDDNNQIIELLSKKSPRPGLYYNMVNAGVYVFCPSFLSQFSTKEKVDLEKDVIAPMILRGDPVYGYKTTEYLKDIGTPERIGQAETELKSGSVASRNLLKKQKAIFLDRDGTINKHKGLIYNHDQLELEQYAAEAIKLINKSSYLALVITNQSVIARNLCDFDALGKLHKKMDVLLGYEGAYIDDLYFCPHHPDAGYPEERKEFKIKCQCRKPATGLIEQAAKDHNLDLICCWIVGDLTADIQTGLNAGVRPVLVKTGLGGTDAKYPVEPLFTAENLLEAVKHILSKEG